MNTYYDVLGISEQATSVEIEKAYFLMVGKYKAERFLEKVMEIRQAYDMLSNDSMRVEYDEWLKMPVELQSNLDNAKELLEDGNYRMAISILEDLRQHFPHMRMIQLLLGEAYGYNDNPQKAITVFKHLVKTDPHNVIFLGNLAYAYLTRGWHKKAVEVFKQATALDKENDWLRIGLADAYVACEKFGVAKKILCEVLLMDQVRGIIAVPIYFKLFLIDIQEHDLQSMSENLAQLSALAASLEDEKEEIGWMLFLVARKIVNLQIFDVAKLILDRVIEIIPHNKEVKELKAVVDEFCKVEDEFSEFTMDTHYCDDFVAFIASKILPTNGIEDDIYALTIAYSFLNDFESNKQYILMLERQYPVIYNRLSKYLKDALNPRKRTKEIKRIEKYLEENKTLMELSMLKELMDEDDWDYDYDEDEWENDEGDYFNPYEEKKPYLRVEPKIGRNNPCPCGSGKKYKNCCAK